MKRRHTTMGLVIFLGCFLVWIRARLPPSPHREGDEIIVAGKLFHTATSVITWMDSGGYNGYQVVSESFRGRLWRFISGNKRYLRSAGEDLPALQSSIDQLVLHYDGLGLSKLCFEALQSRGLSVHFMIDIDGTVYQTLDLKELALHATVSNQRSIGVEMANIGAYVPDVANPLKEWYQNDEDGRPAICVPAMVGDPRLHTQKFVGRPAQPFLIHGSIQGKELVQYDFTAEQYVALTKLALTIGKVFPLIKPTYPRDSNASGALTTHKISDEDLVSFRGILGHYHIQSNKVDPGPAFQWDNLIGGIRSHP